jgi:arginine/lysine/ornithine decarboxylase
MGNVCAEIIAPCPPGVPLIMPGELIGAEEVKLLKTLNINKIKITEASKNEI